MKTSIKTPTIPIFILAAAGILFMVCTWIRFVRIEAKLTEHDTKIYVIDLVQNELLDRQGLHIEVRGAESAVGNWHSPASENTVPAITLNDDEDEEESAQMSNKRKRR